MWRMFINTDSIPIVGNLTIKALIVLWKQIVFLHGSMRARTAKPEIRQHFNLLTEKWHPLCRYVLTKKSGKLKRFNKNDTELPLSLLNRHKCYVSVTVHAADQIENLPCLPVPFAHQVVHVNMDKLRNVLQSETWFGSYLINRSINHILSVNEML